MQDGLTTMVANCDQEPIHALGCVQSHGALLCFDKTGRLLSHSATAARFLGPLPGLSEPYSALHFDPAARALLDNARMDTKAVLEGIECAGPNGQRFDLIAHWSGDTLIAEWETIEADAPAPGHYAVLAQQAIRSLQDEDFDTVPALLQAAVASVRAMTGFDRVMGYRFLQDDSGEVVAEAKHADLPPFLQQRYPAGDIPAQARRLYVLQPIRQIASVALAPVPLEPPIHPVTGQAFDLSHSVLRSVSPIHIEYLTNMGVAASMSISIVINGRLWGLIACHHMSEYRASLAVRLSCTVLTQVLSILIERVEFKQRMAEEARTHALSQTISAVLSDATDFASGLASVADSLEKMIDSDALAVVVDQRVVLFGDGVHGQGLVDVAHYMADRHIEKLVVTSVADELPDLPRPLTRNGEAAGLLAIQIPGEPRLTVIWLRDELVETIRWGGPPGKIIAAGPNGPRLTPRGSFEVWKETVRGSCREWTATDRRAARALKAVFQDVALERLRESDRQRMTLLATLGHDLRDPLQAINLAMQLMGRGLANSTDTAKRVQGSTRRMQSLISYILDVSRIRSGIGLSLECSVTSLDILLRSLVDDVRFRYPANVFELQSDVLGEANIDEDRFVQGLTNLLNNARQHGDPDAPIVLVGRREPGVRIIEVRNRTKTRATVSFRRLVDPFKGGSPNVNNPDGLGLGLYIANAIFVGHGATFDAAFDEHEARFSISLPVPE